MDGRKQQGRTLNPKKCRHIYSFAKPAHSLQKSMLSLKPALVTQMQHFGYQGRLEKIVDVITVRYWTGWFVKEIRDFVRTKSCRPDFVIMGESLCDPTQSPRRLMGAAMWPSDTNGTASNDKMATLWVGNVTCTMRYSSAGTYQVFINLHLVLQWKPKLSQTVRTLSSLFPIFQLRSVNASRRAMPLRRKSPVPIVLLLV